MNSFSTTTRRSGTGRRRGQGGNRARRLRLESMESRLLLSAEPVGIEPDLLTSVASVVSAELYEQALADNEEIAILPGPQGRVWQWIVKANLVNNDVRETLYVAGVDAADPVTVHVLGSIFPLVRNANAATSFVASATPDFSTVPSPVVETPVAADPIVEPAPTRPLVVEPVEVEPSWPQPDTQPIDRGPRQIPTPESRDPRAAEQPTTAPSESVPDRTPNHLPVTPRQVDPPNPLGIEGFARTDPAPDQVGEIAVVNREIGGLTLQIVDLLPQETGLPSLFDTPALFGVNDAIQITTLANDDFDHDGTAQSPNIPLVDVTPTRHDDAEPVVSQGLLPDRPAPVTGLVDESPNADPPTVVTLLDVLSGIGVDAGKENIASRREEPAAERPIELSKTPTLAAARIEAAGQAVTDESEGGPIALATVLETLVVSAPTPSIPDNHLAAAASASARSGLLARAVAFESIDPLPAAEVELDLTDRKDRQPVVLEQRAAGPGVAIASESADDLSAPESPPADHAAALGEWDDGSGDAARVESGSRRYPGVVPVLSILALERITAPRRRAKATEESHRRVLPRELA